MALEIPEGMFHGGCSVCKFQMTPVSSFPAQAWGAREPGVPGVSHAMSPLLSLIGCPVHRRYQKRFHFEVCRRYLR